MAESNFPIVGIGASAGGLEALRQLLEHIPANTGLGFVVIQHLDPKHESILADLLARITKMPVAQVKDGMAVEPDHVYVVPPNVDMKLEDRALKLLPRGKAAGVHMAIDYFLRSLAHSRGSQAIGIILSGSGTDGSLGLEDVKDKGGITFVQDESTAKFASMPHSAILTGAVDYILPVEGIARELVRIARHPYVSSAAIVTKEEDSPAPTPADQNHLDQILRLLRNASGTDFHNYKNNTIQRRIARRMALRKIERLDEYAAYLKKNPEELKYLFQDILIKVTSFFRDPESFEALKQKIIPGILKNHVSKKPVRIWVPGCATGEEAYSILLCFLECLESKGSDLSIQMFATDIDESALQKARTGLYIENISMDVSAERLRRFFTKEDHQYRIHKSIREMCTFARHDLGKDPPFSHMDLISCRNVLIYFQQSLQKRVIPLFHYALNPNGFLTLGSSETIGAFSDLFSFAYKKLKIYVKKLTPVRPPIEFVQPEYRPETAKTVRRPESKEEQFWAEPDVFKVADRVLLSHYAPAGVLVNEQMCILQFRGNTGQYLSPAPGKASFNLLSMVKEGLLAAIKSAVTHAKKTGVPVTRENVRFRYDGKFSNVTLKVIPVDLPSSFIRHFVVLFEEISSTPGETKKGKRRQVFGKREAHSRDLDLLRQELELTKQHLQSVIENSDATNEELKSANEEILSSNEELQSTNEELETSKEELQATNEELSTVNEEVQHRNLELSQANNDLNNLFTSANLPIILLGSDLRIRRFTQMAERVNIIPSDAGRPISDLKLSIHIPDLESLLTEAIQNVSTKELEVQDRRNQWYSLRIQPYRTAENKIEGVVLFFVDITSVKAAEKLTLNLDELQIARNYSEGIVQTVIEPLVILDPSLRVILANPSFYRIFQVSKEETEKQFIYKLGKGQWDIPNLRTLLSDILAKGSQLENFEVEHDFPRIGRRVMLLNAQRITLDEAGTETILLAIQDITDSKRFQEVLQENAGMAVMSLDTEGRVMDWNTGSERIFGYTGREIIGQHFSRFFPPEDQSVGKPDRNSNRRKLLEQPLLTIGM